MNLRTLTLSTLAALSLVSCGKDDDNSGEAAKLAAQVAKEQEVINDVVKNVIIPTYTELNGKTKALETALTALEKSPSNATLTAARQAWKAARSPWEQSEGFLYGPVKLPEDLDEAMDTWPVDVQKMNTVLTGTAPITPAVIAQNPETRGFHLIEFLIWGENGQATAASLTARQKLYLKAAAQDMKNNTNAVLQGWTSGKYAENFAKASAGTGKYKSTAAAVSEIASGLWHIANEVAAEKIANCFNEAGEPLFDKEESRFSNNSKKDFADNIRSIQNIYLGKYNGVQGKGLSDLVKEKDAALDAKLKAKIQEAINNLEAIPGTFTEAIVKTNAQGRAAVTKAQNTIGELRDIIEKELGKYYSISKG